MDFLGRSRWILEEGQQDLVGSIVDFKRPQGLSAGGKGFVSAFWRCLDPGRWVGWPDLISSIVLESGWPTAAQLYRRREGEVG